MARTGCGWGATANAASSSSVGPRPGRLRPFLLRFVHSSFSLPLSLRRFSSSTHFLPSPFASFRSVRSLSLSLFVPRVRVSVSHPLPSQPLSSLRTISSLLHPSLSFRINHLPSPSLPVVRANEHSSRLRFAFAPFPPPPPRSSSCHAAARTRACVQSV